MRMMRIATVGVAAGLTMAATGCGTGLGTVTQNATAAAGVGTISGSVYGGQQPISGATIQMYAVGIAGLQSASTALIAGLVTTNQNGNFTIAGDWDCTSNTTAYGVNPLIYIVATQGNPGLRAGVNNTAIAAMAAIGPCSSFTATSFVSINERTTVAAVYALAPFMADYAHVGARGANAVGLVNAFQTANAIANSSTGAAPGPALAANGTAPVTEINTLADIIASCINSNGTDGNCSSLFAATTPTSGSVPANTIAAALAIASNPSSNVTTLYNLALGKPPFQPTLASAPNDWTVALNFTGGGLNAPTGIALDANGNAWVANAGGNSVTELGITGQLLTGSAGYGSGAIVGAQGIAVDRTGNVWVADTLLSSVVRLNVIAGVVQSSTSFTSGGISGPVSLAIDSQNNVWVSNFASGSVTELNSDGVPLSSSPLTAGGLLQSPAGIAVDVGGNVWVTDNGAALVVEFSNGHALMSGTGYTDGAMLAPWGIALDGSGHANVTDNGINALSLFGANGSSLLKAPLVGGGLAMPAGIALDGNALAWIANDATPGSISAFSAAGPIWSPIGLGLLRSATAIAVDASGSVWTANTGDNSVSEFIGVASPAAMPLAAKAGP